MPVVYIYLLSCSNINEYCKKNGPLERAHKVKNESNMLKCWTLSENNTNLLNIQSTSIQKLCKCKLKITNFNNFLPKQSFMVKVADPAIQRQELNFEIEKLKISLLFC